MKINPASLATTARKALATVVAVGTAVEATGAITGHLNSLLVQGIAIGGAILSATVVYAIPNASPKPNVTAANSEANEAIFEKFVYDSSAGGSNAV